ncbi:zf-HC2 domain-containing protein [Brevibacillus ruminantium]|uniref:Anti-sigma-W factor RsiW n=1 Tax=Brevibacillus ruminantium TaxID=2950604 RepID=A0ABY4W8I8_9BACL|nr:zf-HC2 domain-containing protein [Brevibacillus ruminantium]USG63495.1 zf-HC2 domain-containing protein [Brevibacillus ruminantium]
MMKCEEVQDRMPDYADGLLPDITRRRMDHHLASCSSCRSDYSLWQDSSNWMETDKEQYHSITPTRSIVDAVMARILSEEKWAIPIGRKVFAVTARMRRIGASAAVILMMLCTFTLYVNSTNAEQANSLLIGNEVLAMGKHAQVVTSSTQSEDGTYIVEPQPLVSEGQPLASATASIIPMEGKAGEQDHDEPNYGMVLSLFGILVTVLTMSWFTRA